MKRILPFVYVVMLATSLSNAQNYVGIDMYMMAPSPWPETEGYTTATSGQVVGSAGGHAWLWTEPNGVGVDLHPTNLGNVFRSFINHATGTQQVGHRINVGSEDVRATMWSGTAQSAVDLHPATGFSSSQAFATNGNQQVGRASSGVIFHAFLWNGSAATAVDLHPIHLDYVFVSQAMGTDGIHQVGVGFDRSAIHGRALLWNGAANTAVNLNPPGMPGSQAFGVSGTQQVGFVATNPFSNGPTHAYLWHGTAASGVDLCPASYGFANSAAVATNGQKQVGWGDDHALMWSGSAESLVDLHNLLPGGFIRSKADTIDANGVIYGRAVDAGLRWHAVKWVPVPEPSAIALIAVGWLGTTVGRRLRYGRNQGVNQR